MASLGNEIDLECGGTGHHRRHLPSDENQCFTDADEGSCYSQFYSDDPEIGRVSDDDEASSDYSVDVAGGDEEGKIVKVELGNNNKRDCRICHLSGGVEEEEEDDEEEGVMELGCCCKGDLAAAHKHCADTWFKIKGNKTCEICNSIVSNLIGPNETLSIQGITSNSSATTNIATTHSSTTTQRRGCINGHRLLNFILACMVFAFVISWLFHFNIPS